MYIVFACLYTLLCVSIIFLTTKSPANPLAPDLCGDNSPWKFSHSKVTSHFIAFHKRFLLYIVRNPISTLFFIFFADVKTLYPCKINVSYAISATRAPVFLHSIVGNLTVFLILPLHLVPPVMPAASGGSVGAAPGAGAGIGGAPARALVAPARVLVHGV